MSNFQFDEESLKKIEALRASGINPYPQFENSSETILDRSIDELRELCLEYLDCSPFVRVSGRLRFKNDMGGLGFGRLDTHGDRIQFMINKREISAEMFSVWKSFDLGDVISVSGAVTRTRSGELTIRVNEIRLLSKCISSMPDKVTGLANPELCQRKRYLDLMTNKDSFERFANRSKMISFVRRYFERNNFMEVETPMLQTIPGGASAKPFTTHHNALDCDLFMRIAPELYLKRLIVGGYNRVFEIGKNFRNEGISTRHNPEFTMIEFYMAYNNYRELIFMINELLDELTTLFDKDIVSFGGHSVDLKNVSVVTYRELISGRFNIDCDDISQLHSAWIDAGGSAEKLTDNVHEMWVLLFEEYVEHTLVDPTFVTEFPVCISPLARRSTEDPNIAERFELYIGGIEIANGFNELNDPVDQANRFAEQAAKKAGGDDEAMYFDSDYIEALCYGMPPTAGAGIGLDRLAMILTEAQSIRDVILFPTMK